MLKRSPPAALAAAFGETPLLATTGDRLRDGRAGESWLLVSAERVAVWDDASAAAPACDFSIADVESFRAQAGVGAGVLQARTGGAWIDLVRYSNALAQRFAKVAGKLEDLRKTGELDIRPEDDRDERKCAKCGMTLQFVGDVCPRCIPRQAVFRRAMGLLKPYRLSAIWLSLLVFAGLAIDLAPPLLQKHLVDDVLKLDSAPNERSALLAALMVLVALLAVSRLIGSFVGWLKGWLAVRVGAGLTRDLRARLVGKLHELPIGYYDKHQVGVLVNRVVTDTEAMHSVVAHLTGGFAMQILQLVGVGIALFLINAKLAFFMLLPTPLVVGGSWFFWRYIYPLYYRYWDSSSKQAGALSGMLSGMRVVKAFGQEEREYERFGRSSDRLHETRVGVESSTATFSAAMQVVFSLGGLIVWYVGGRDVLGGSMSLGALIAFLAYLAMFYAPLANMAQLTAWLGGFMTAAQRVFELLDSPNQIVDAAEPKRVPNMQGRVAFENVTFGYDRHRPVVKEVSFAIEPGEAIGIVGRSGSGKTTVVNLISRFYDCDAGRVTIDGVDVKEIARDDLRRQVGVVLQEPFLFRGTLWKNLVYGKPHAAPDEVIAAARAASAHDFILRQPLAYESPVGERGAGLSGGERQRLSIARAVLYDPKILILDEATSSVDTESEKAIQDALAEFTRGRTTVAIAHRLSTLRNSDRIMVFDAGKLAEVGSHRELVLLDGIYANLVRIQTRLGGEDNLERLIEAESSTAVAVAEPVDEESNDHSDPPPSRNEQKPADDFWLDPCNAELRTDEWGGLVVATVDGETYRGVTAIRAFPASWPTKYISLRATDADGKEKEIGVVRDLNEWPDEPRGLLDAALARQSDIREIVRIRGLKERQNFLYFDADTNLGRAQFTVRWSQTVVADYGDGGKMLTDVDDNLWVVRDVESLPASERISFRRYVYW